MRQSVSTTFSFVFLSLGIAACAVEAGSGSGPDAPTQLGALGMNDVTMLLPLPASTTSPTVVALTGEAGVGLISRDLFARLVTGPGDVFGSYEEFHLVAIRFDLCDRGAPGPCPSGVDGRLRLVFQPLFSSAETMAFDVALHAFYPIPAGELGEVVDELRALAAIQAVPTTAPLAVNPALTAGEAGYAARLRALVLRYAAPDRLFRLTLFAQDAMSSALNWVFRGVVRAGSGYDDIVIPDLSATQQRTTLVGADLSYDTTPVVDMPAGFVLALSSQAFATATPADQVQAVEALTAIQNPLLHDADTVQCVGCHVSTVLASRRLEAAGLVPATVASRFEAPYDLSIAAGTSEANARSLRALGWFFDQPAISQRVANDTAQVLVEIGQRFPPAR